jgi:transcriptional regulator
MRGIDPNLKRGSAQLAVLSVLVSGPLHGYEISRRIAEQTSGALKFDLASLYPLLYRMERDGWVSAKWEESANGRRRRCYSLTREGKGKLAPLRAQWKQFFSALNSLAGFDHA